MYFTRSIFAYAAAFAVIRSHIFIYRPTLHRNVVADQVIFCGAWRLFNGCRASCACGLQPDKTVLEKRRGAVSSVTIAVILAEHFIFYANYVYWNITNLFLHGVVVVFLFAVLYVRPESLPRFLPRSLPSS